MEIEQKSQFSSQQIQVVKAQMASKARENRMLQLTASEVGALPKETHVYEGVGKM
jgi:prefoldin subunit 1